MPGKHFDGSCLDLLGERKASARQAPDGAPQYIGPADRGRCPIGLMSRSFPDDATLRSALAIADALTEQSGRPPTYDFALALLTRHLKLPPSAALSLFALGRAMGWIGHALEQYAGHRLIRPRARYTGVHP